MRPEAALALRVVLIFDLTVLWAENLTPLDLAEIENLLYSQS